MPSSTRHNDHKPTYSPGSLGAKIEENKRRLIDEIHALTKDDALTDQIEEILIPFLSDLEKLNFNLGLSVAKSMLSDEQDADLME